MTSTVLAIMVLLLGFSILTLILAGLYKLVSIAIDKDRSGVARVAAGGAFIFLCCLLILMSV